MTHSTTMPQFTADTAAVSAKSSHYPGRRYRYSPLGQAVDLQRALHDAALLLSVNVKSVSDDKTRAQLASAMASCAKGFQAMGEQIRVLKGKPLPGTLKPESPKKAKRKRDDLAPTESPTEKGISLPAQTVSTTPQDEADGTGI